MKKAAIVIDTWKLPIFSSILVEKGYHYTEQPGLTPDTLLLTVPNQLGVDYNAHVIEAILKHVAPAMGWR